MPLKLIGYTRVSTNEQALYGYGLAAQASKLREYARRNDVDIEIVRDDGISGATLERPALMRALQKIADGEADGLVAPKLDRLSRSAIDFMMLVEWFEAAGAQLVVLDIQMDNSTPTGRLMVHMIAILAEFERGIISQRTREALAARRAQGLPTGRPAVESATAMRIRELRESGMTYQAICDELNTDGVPTARGAGEWRPSAIQSALGYKRRPKRKKIANLPEIAPKRRAA